jgi:hypothetical protein
MLLWNKKPVEFALCDIDDIAVKSDVDGLSGAANLSVELPAEALSTTERSPRRRTRKRAD